MKTKLVQHVPRIIFNIYKNFKFQIFLKISKISKNLNFSGSQRLSDFQTFFLKHPVEYIKSTQK